MKLPTSCHLLSDPMNKLASLRTKAIKAEVVKPSLEADIADFYHIVQAKQGLKQLALTNKDVTAALLYAGDNGMVSEGVPNEGETTESDDSNKAIA